MGEVKSIDHIKFEIPIEGIEDIRYLVVGCGCTKVQIDKEKSAITGVIDIAHAGGSRFAGTPIGINKTITVHEEDGESDFVANDKGVRIVNPAHKFVRLNVVGTVTQK